MTMLSEPKTQIGGKTQTFEWVWQHQTHRIAYEVLGKGTPVLLLPAFSTVSTRAEMRGIAQQLAPHVQVTAMDWLGFGDSDRPALNYQPTLYCQLLHDFVRAHFDQPVAVIAAGHAAGYVMQAAKQHLWSKIVLVAPTWQGPLRVMGAPTPLRDAVRGLVNTPGIGQALYGLNTLPAFLKFMYRRHVYVNANRLTTEFIGQKHQTTQQPRARFAPAAFVTGTLDPMVSREEFLQAGQSLTVSTVVVMAEQAPPQSKASMQSLMELPNIEQACLSGSLGLHEEYADQVAAMALPYLMTS
jgi:pimeloyl-ACP methyl ester carboxylesterase